MNKEIKVTVLLGMYNGSKYIESQLDSLLNQTFPIANVYIGDDCSTDCSKTIVKKYIEEHHLEKSWFLVENKKNLGHAGNFISLCKKVSGDYTFFCDQDDIWMPDKVEKMVSIMEDNHSISLLYGDELNTTSPEKFVNSHTENTEMWKVEKIPFSARNYFFKGLGCTTCLRTEFVHSFATYWVEGWEHDMFFWACANLTESGYHLQSPVIWRRIHADNASMQVVKTYDKRKKQIIQSVKRATQLERLLQEKHISEDRKIRFVQGYKKVLLRRERAMKKNNPFLALCNLFGGRTNYFLYRSKGVILDVVLIVFRVYPIKMLFKKNK